MEEFQNKPADIESGLDWLNATPDQIDELIANGDFDLAAHKAKDRFFGLYRVHRRDMEDLHIDVVKDYTEEEWRQQKDNILLSLKEMLPYLEHRSDLRACFSDEELQDVDRAITELNKHISGD